MPGRTALGRGGPFTEGTGFVRQPGLGLGEAAAHPAAQPRVLLTAGADLQPLAMGFDRHRLEPRADRMGHHAVPVQLLETGIS